MKGRFIWEIADRGGVVVAHGAMNNTITTAGLNANLDGEYGTGWFLGLVDASGFTAFAAADTMASHAGWTEFTSYDESTRPAWDTSAAAAGKVINATSADFTINAAGTLKGLFVATDSTKSGTTGTLWSTAPFSVSQPVFIGQNFRLYYELTIREG